MAGTLRKSRSDRNCYLSTLLGSTPQNISRCMKSKWDRSSQSPLPLCLINYSKGVLLAVLDCGRWEGYQGVGSRRFSMLNHTTSASQRDGRNPPPATDIQPAMARPRNVPLLCTLLGKVCLPAHEVGALQQLS